MKRSLKDAIHKAWEAAQRQTKADNSDISNRVEDDSTNKPMTANKELTAEHKVRTATPPRST